MNTKSETDEGERQEPSPPETASNEFPDGGLRAWLVVVGAFFGLFTSFGWTNCEQPAIIQSLWLTNLLRRRWHFPSILSKASAANYVRKHHLVDSSHIHVHDVYHGK
jgi:hypothetical protein